MAGHERQGIVAAARVFVEHAPDAVVDMVQRIHVVGYLLQALAAGIVRERGGICHAEVAVEVEHNLLGHKRLPAVGHGRAAGQLLRLHVLEPLSAPQREQQVLLLGRRLHHARVGQNDGGVLVALGHAVNHDAVQLARVHVFLLHVDVAVGDSVVEHALGNFQFGALLLHRDEQLGDFHVGLGPHIVLKIERGQADEHGNCDERPKGLHERDAGRLDGCELRTLAQIAESDERAQQDGQRKSLGNEHQGHVPEELRHHFHGQSLADELVDESPQKLHHQHKLADEERSYE